MIFLSVILMLLEPFYYETYFSFEGSFGFYGWFLSGCAALFWSRGRSAEFSNAANYYDADRNSGEDNR